MLINLQNVLSVYDVLGVGDAVINSQFLSFISSHSIINAVKSKLRVLDNTEEDLPTCLQELEKAPWRK